MTLEQFNLTFILNINYGPCSGQIGFMICSKKSAADPLDSRVARQPPPQRADFPPMRWVFTSAHSAELLLFMIIYLFIYYSLDSTFRNLLATSTQRTCSDGAHYNRMIFYNCCELKYVRGVGPNIWLPAFCACELEGRSLIKCLSNN